MTPATYPFPPQPNEILTRCSCGCPLTREFWARERDAGRTRTQICDGCDHDLELARCPHCGSHRSVQIPSWRRHLDEEQDRREDAVAEFTRRQAVERADRFNLWVATACFVVCVVIIAAVLR